jgi:hypothetical protein
MQREQPAAAVLAVPDQQRLGVRVVIGGVEADASLVRIPVAAINPISVRIVTDHDGPGSAVAACISRPTSAGVNR